MQITGRLLEMPPVVQTVLIIAGIIAGQRLEKARCQRKDPAGRSSQGPTRPAGPVFYSAKLQSVRHGTTAWTLHLARSAGQLFRIWPTNSGNTDSIVCRKVLATRKPLLLLRLSGWLWLRLADRTFCALLLNDPPRNTRLVGRRPLESDCSEQPPS